MNKLVDIIIPTYNNPQYAFPCIRSILGNKITDDLFRIIVVNNGHKKSFEGFSDPNVKVLQMKENAGWEGGLKAGLTVSDAPFVVFMNDDTYVPTSSVLWLAYMLNHFADPLVAGVGPSSNFVMGPQNIFLPIDSAVLKTKYIIGFCAMYRKDYLEEAGGIDDSLPNHGDDLDLGIRLRKLGKKLVVDRRIFILHHGCQTGARELKQYWNSAEMNEKTMNHLIMKHGLKSYMETITNAIEPHGVLAVNEDTEGQIVKKYINGKMLELGCGAKKTVESSVGMDIVPKGERIPGLKEEISVADVVGDIEKPLPFKGEFDTIIARHILEHCINPIETIKNWTKALKLCGRIIVAVPDHTMRNTIPLNFQHVHAYTKDNLKTLMETCGFKTLVLEDSKNNVSFVGVFELVIDPALTDGEKMLEVLNA